jgi:SAM-dependent methyltransferase
MNFYTITIISLVIVALCFSLSLRKGAPYVPTLTPQVTVALDLLDLKPGQMMLELGCGDGKVLIAAAKRGWNTVGYEINPLLALIAYIRTRKYGKQVKIVWGNFLTNDWPKADGIFVFGLPKFMLPIDKKTTSYSKFHPKLVTFAFAIPHRSVVSLKSNIYLYKY